MKLYRVDWINNKIGTILVVAESWEDASNRFNKEGTGIVIQTLEVMIY